MIKIFKLIRNIIITKMQGTRERTDRNRKYILILKKKWKITRGRGKRKGGNYGKKLK